MDILPEISDLDKIDYSKKVKFTGFEIKSEYIRMRDGIELAITYCLPVPLESKVKLPTILFLTRYWRSNQFRFPLSKLVNELYALNPIPKVFTARGYVILFVDCRGTGASYGSRPYPFFDEEIKDGNDIIDWVLQQSWSNGKVTAYGISYVGTMAELIARNKHPALKAIIPTHCFYDTYVENVYPGGVYDYQFAYNWETLCRGLDQNDNSVLRKLNLLSWILAKGIKKVFTDSNGEKLNEAIIQHVKNVYAHELISDNQFRDDSLSGGISYKDISIFTHQKAIEEAGVPYLNIASWFDSGYGDSVIKRFVNMNSSGIYILGDWNHGYRVSANPYYPKRKQIIPTMDTKEAASTFVHYLADFLDIALSDQIEGKTLYYYTLGEEKWKKTNQWPPKGQRYERWYMNENYTLTQSMPTKDEPGKDTYKVDFNATTGNRNRWWTLLSFPIDYTERTEQDRLCLTYSSSLLTEKKEITGHAIITLNLTSTHEDGAIFAYLEDVDDQGNVVYLSEGQLRLIHHKISTEDPPFKINIPYHTYHKGDALPLTPGQVTKVSFGLLPVSAQIKPGHRIRISFAGHDKNTFQRYPKEGNPILEIYRNSTYSSYVDLPVIQQDSL